MKIATMLGLAFTLIASAAYADPPDVTGTWKTTDLAVQYSSGAQFSAGSATEGEGSITLQVDEQNGPIFNGTLTWEGQGQSADQRVTGVFKYDDRSFVIVDAAVDGTVHEGEVDDDGTITVVGFEPGERPLVLRARFAKE